MDIAKVLFQRRIELGITQLELAQYCGFIYKSSISRLESGERQWKFENVLTACELLKLNLSITEAGD